ncbi:MAG: hypothetical protein COU29_03160 [Candidatus Magasanikbacteria bacterium CG10_big_fil_rev_8_21_14_0_10_36_32]|uniref:DUF5666 domain-containing protein n=1 Tax=Candidatus Magasanikbacteria bacterium CG10_big_fil_rev_8_21_14_0_10_36_32 TaxID=1974646 RepID=A0A2M6W669_9BACT|nr:MAG: hypothetical protein COU29_03160 [Candidatus Magasanikbacteria bacterium CG10_big_fil_rev_8_21_14_0_10_36_32]
MNQYNFNKKLRYFKLSISVGFVFSIIILTLLTMGAGCNTLKQEGDVTSNNIQEKQQNDFGNRISSSTPKNDMQVMGTSTDLIIGKKVIVMGVTNSDSTITAQQIIIGDISIMMAFNSSTNKQPRFNSSTLDDSNEIIISPATEKRQFQPPTSGEMPDKSQFRQWSDNEGNTPPNNNTRQARLTSSQSVIGEIIKKDDISLVVKLNDGGSSIVFYSGSTKIFILTPPPADKNNQN